jgi:hypothetical protein
MSLRCLRLESLVSLIGVPAFIDAGSIAQRGDRRLPVRAAEILQLETGMGFPRVNTMY